MEIITGAVVLAIAQTALNKFIESGAGELGKSFASGSSEKIRQKVQQLGEFVWQRLRGKPEVVAVLPGVEQSDPQAVQEFKGQVEQVLQDENDDFTKRVRELVTEIHQEIQSEVQAKNSQQIFGGQGLQVNDPQAPVIQAKDSPITFNYNN